MTFKVTNIKHAAYIRISPVGNKNQVLYENWKFIGFSVRRDATTRLNVSQATLWRLLYSAPSNVACRTKGLKTLPSL